MGGAGGVVEDGAVDEAVVVIVGPAGFVPDVRLNWGTPLEEAPLVLVVVRVGDPDVGQEPVPNQLDDLPRDLMAEYLKE